MEREIKFRARCIEHGEFYGKMINGFGVYFWEEDDGMKAELYSIEGVTQVDPETVGQYTGQGDFYAGDIAKSPRGSIGTIEWHDSWCGFYFKTMFGHNDEGKLVRTHSSIPLYNDLPNYIKLGNRWDNPDLLEGGYE